MSGRESTAKATRRTRWVRLLLLSLGLYVAACIGCASFQRRLIYFPPKFALSEIDELAKGERLERWKKANGELLGWKRSSPVQPSEGKVLITHGNACCAFQCGHFADSLQQAAAFDVFIVEYPGYGGQPGSPNELSLYEAAHEALENLGTNGPVFLLGESLGTGVSAHLAGCYPKRIAGVVLLAPYSRLSDVGQAHMPILPVRLLLREHFPAEQDLRNYHGPVAVLVGARDTVVPAKCGHRLFQAYAGPKRLWELPEATHETLMDQPPVLWQQVIAFWRTHPRTE